MAADRMCGLAARARRISCAELGSLKASGAVLFVPRIFARALRSSRRSSLKRYTPYSANAMPATHSATKVLIMITRVSLRRSESLRVQCILIIRPSVRSRHRACQREQLGTHFQTRAAGGADVDRHSHAGILHHKLNHSARSDKIVHVRHRQNAGAAQLRQNGWQSLVFRFADEKNVAGAQIVRRPKLLDLQ